ncbi:hypothetical protein O181_004049 [Austropuccinia psidii MF-1]|uniref:Integrase catalytic domain-containing protein n=1 Tax=Austropuccinia psidii MF-1 TaxID=1389203 RepID=A0A9Q3GEG0_9BASI|nr:hypothetical protein [Austropuccinia psidii MF-1]
MDTALLIWNRVISRTDILKKIISDRDSKLTSGLWTNLHKLLGTKLSFSTAYHLQKDGLSEIIINTLWNMITIFCAYGLEIEDFDGFSHDWCTFIPALELAYKNSIHASTGKTSEMFDKGWIPKIPVSTLKEYLVSINTATS